MFKNALFFFRSAQKITDKFGFILEIYRHTQTIRHKTKINHQIHNIDFGVFNVM